MIPDRTQAPAFKQVDHIELLRAASHQLDNGVPLYVVEGGDQDLIRIEFLFSNVNWNLAKPLQTYAVSSMLTEGTSARSANEIAAQVDYYGAFLQCDYNYDYSTVTLSTLTRHLEATLPIVKDIITNSTFPERELETFRRNQKQKLLVNLEKNDFIARKMFSRVLFGDSVYGFSSDASHYDSLDRDQLVAYFNLAYRPENCTIIAAGKAGDDAVKLINRYFGSGWDTGPRTAKNVFAAARRPGSEHYHERPGALQSAIRIGQVSINRGHPEFPAMQVLNTVLGGYFGSRLMTNIREDKGYTYGIGSALVSLQNAGYFFIASEVGAEVCGAAIGEIEKEVNLLKTEPIGSDELQLVKNYMIGSFLGSLENAFSHADKFKNIFFSGLDYDYYDRYLHVVRSISAEELMQLAGVHLDFDRFEKVIVGQK
jgi:zinc protease